MRESAACAFDTAMEMMGHPYRRQLLVALLEHTQQADDSPDPLDIDSQFDEPEVYQLDLFHNHLPQLEKSGYITWNQDTREISRGPDWDEIAPLIALLHTHRDDLPDGWL